MSQKLQRQRPDSASQLVRRPEPIRTGGAEHARPPAVAAQPTQAAVPAPYESTGDGELGPREREHLTVCEGALDNLRIAFWAAGKALHVIRDARLYRDGYATFEDYLSSRWDMSRAQAYRLIDAWPLAERLSPIGDKVNESQVRELLPVADRHGRDAAVLVYRTIAETGGVPVTAAILRGAVGVLPAGHFDAAAAAEQIRSYLAGSSPAQSARPAPNPVETFTAEATKLVRVLHRVAERGTLKAAAHQDPDAVRKVIAEMRSLLDEIEQVAL